MSLPEWRRVHGADVCDCGHARRFHYSPVVTNQGSQGKCHKRKCDCHAFALGTGGEPLTVGVRG